MKLYFKWLVLWLFSSFLLTDLSPKKPSALQNSIILVANASAIMDVGENISLKYVIIGLWCMRPNSVMDVVYPDNQLTLSSPFMGISSDTRALGRKRDSQEDMIERTVQKKNIPFAIDNPYAIALMMERILWSWGLFRRCWGRIEIGSDGCLSKGIRHNPAVWISVLTCWRSFNSIRILRISCCSKGRWTVVMKWKRQYRSSMAEKSGAEATPHWIVIKGWWDLSFTWSERCWRRGYRVRTLP